MSVNVGDTVLFETADGQRTLMVVASEPQLTDDGTVTFKTRPTAQVEASEFLKGWFYGSEVPDA